MKLKQYMIQNPPNYSGVGDSSKEYWNMDYPLAKVVEFYGMSHTVWQYVFNAMPFTWRSGSNRFYINNLFEQIGDSEL